MPFVVEFLGPIIKRVSVNEGTEISKLTMRNVGDIKNPALRNRPTNEDTKEVLEIIRKRAEDLKNSDVHFDEVLLRRVSVTRPNEPLPSIRVENDLEASEKSNSRSCPDELDHKQALEIRWRSLSDATLTELRNRSPLARSTGSPASDTTPTSRRRRIRRMSDLPPLEASKERLERPKCVPSIRSSNVALLQPKDAVDINHNVESEDNYGENDFHHY